MSESDQDLKILIEQHIKSMLSISALEQPAEACSSGLKIKMNPFFCDNALLPEPSRQMQPHESLKAFPQKENLLQNCCSSQLIDLNVLTDFAAKHVGSGSDIISPMPGVLPHPELDGSSFFPVEGVTEEQLAAYAHVDKPPGFKTKPIGQNSQSSGEFQTEPNKVKESKVKTEYKRTKKRKKKKQDAESKQNQSADESQKSNSVENSPVHVLTKKEKAQGEPPKSSKKKSSEKKKEVPLLNEEVLKKQLPEEALVYSLICYGGLKRFSCNLCAFDANSESAALEHLESSKHNQAVEAAEEEKILPFLPKPLPSQVAAISEFLKQWHSKVGLEEGDIIGREQLSLRLKLFVETQVPGCSVEMIGSSSTGIGLKESVVDFIFKVEPELNVPGCLQALFQKLSLEPSFTNVESEFTLKSPGVKFHDQETSLCCRITYEKSLGLAEKFAKLVSMYTNLDPRVPVLGSCFRYWAKICGIDNKENGTLPGYSYAILLIYFLQQVQPPVLPVLHELKEYGNNDFSEEYLKKKKWQGKNEDSLGELWLKMFRFYSLTYELGNHVVCIRHARKVLCSEKNWSTKFYAIEDPFVRRNVAHVIPSYQISQYIQQCFSRTYQYFAYPLLKNGKVKLKKHENFDAGLLECFSASNVPETDDMDQSSASEPEEVDIDELEDQDPELEILDVLKTISKMRLDEKQDSLKKEVGKEKSSKTETKKCQQNFCSWDVSHPELSLESYAYKMDGQLFKKKGLPYTCKTCKSSGHTKKNCPKDELPPPSLLPEMSQKFMKLINKALNMIKDHYCVTAKDQQFIQKKMKDIERHIRKEFPKACLSMFGSFVNGFGFKDRSDMDFCLTFKGMDSGKELDCAEVIEKVAQQLKLHPQLENIISVTSAKVPIVKFSCKESGLDGDISLYNTLALVNTQMLHTYCKIDDRVQILGVVLKYFAKALGICDASRGSLSSYAYILMVIFFLQQRDPPVIPVLQELYEGEKPSEIIDGWNVWYFKDAEDAKKLAEKWPHHHENKESVGQLWLALLSFYAHDFPWKEYVISIRQKALLTRFEKLWMTNALAIEDPFDLNHNLGVGLSHKMTVYILKTFIKGRERFGKPPSDLNALYKHELSYLFNANILTSGMQPPHDRGCRACGKIGHLAKNCTEGKLCAYCNQSGHLVKNCPKKSESKMKRQPEPKSQNKTQGFKGSNQSSDQPHFPAPHAQDSRKKDNKIPGFANRNVDEREQARQLIELGYPTHRFPPPGFPQKFNHNQAPPGFSPRFPAHANSSNLNGPRFRPPHHLLQAQSPLNHSGSSPPRNLHPAFHNMIETNTPHPRMPEPIMNPPIPGPWHPLHRNTFPSQNHSNRNAEPDWSMARKQQLEGNWYSPESRPHNKKRSHREDSYLPRNRETSW